MAQFTQQAALAMVPSGRYLPTNAFAGALRILVVIADHDADQLSDFATGLLELQLHHPYLKPVLLITALDPEPLSAAGFLYETAMSEQMWERAGFVASHADYLDERIAEMAATYLVARTVRLGPGEAMPRWILDR